MSKYLVSLIEETRGNWEEGEDGPDISNDYLYEMEPMNRQEVVKIIEHYGISSASSYPLSNKDKHSWLESVDSDKDYSTGEDKYYHLFIYNPNGNHVGGYHLKKLAKLAGFNLK